MDSRELPEGPALDAAAALRALGALEYHSGGLDAYLTRIAESVSQLLGIDWSVVTLEDSPGYDRILASSKDIGGAADATYPLHGTVTARVMDLGRPLCVADAATAPEFGTLPEGFRSYVGVPLRTSDGRTIGTICSFHGTAREFSQGHVQVISLFAERAAAAIERFSAFRRLEAFNDRLEGLVEERTRQLQEAQSRLVQRERLAAIGEFASMITHEIRSPLATIDLVLEHVLQGAPADGVARRVRLALQESGRLQSLLNEILLFAKPHALDLEPLDLAAWVRETALAAAARPEAQGRSLDLRCLTDPAVAFGDRDKLTQVLVNLLTNAFQATAPGQVVSVWLDDEAGPDRFRLLVRNPGSIPEQDLPRVTEPFFTTRPQGTGLGLAIVKRIVEAHSGTLEIGSDPASGVTVTVTLRRDGGRSTS